MHQIFDYLILNKEFKLFYIEHWEIVEETRVLCKPQKMRYVTEILTLNVNSLNGLY